MSLVAWNEPWWRMASSELQMSCRMPQGILNLEPEWYLCCNTNHPKIEYFPIKKVSNGFWCSCGAPSSGFATQSFAPRVPPVSARTRIEWYVYVFNVFLLMTGLMTLIDGYCFHWLPSHGIQSPIPQHWLSYLCLWCQLYYMLVGSTVARRWLKEGLNKKALFFWRHFR